MRYREHRRFLDESLETVQEFPDKAALIAYLRKDLAWAMVHLDESKLTIEPYPDLAHCYDERCGWNTYIVHLKGFGVLGFTDGPAEDGPKPD